MANICIKSFQVLNDEDISKEFTFIKPSTKMAYLPNIGRDGTRVFGALLGNDLDESAGGYWINANQAYVGLRLYPHLYNDGSSDYGYIGLSSHMALNHNNYADFLTLKYHIGKLILPDGSELTCSDEPFYLELGYDGHYGEIRKDGVVIYRSVFEDVTSVKWFRFFSNHYYGDDRIIAFQDFYINNGEGVINNSFWGDIRVDAYQANTTVGNSGFAIEGEGISEIKDAVAIPVNKGTYARSNAVGAKAEVKAVEIPADSAPLSVAVTNVFTKVDVGDHTVTGYMNDHDTELAGPVVPAAAGEIVNQSSVFETDKDGLSWTRDKVNALTYGFSIEGTSND